MSVKKENKKTWVLKTVRAVGTYYWSDKFDKACKSCQRIQCVFQKYCAQYEQEWEQKVWCSTIIQSFVWQHCAVLCFEPANASCIALLYLMRLHRKEERWVDNSYLNWQKTLFYLNNCSKSLNPSQVTPNYPPVSAEAVPQWVSWRGGLWDL